MSMMQGLSLLGLIAVVVWLLARYFSYKWNGNSFKHVGILLISAYTAAVMGCSLLAMGTMGGVQVVPDTLLRWARHDSLADGRMGASSILFMVVVFGFGALIMYGWHYLIQKAGNKLQNPKAFIVVKILTVILIMYPSILLGISLNANGIHLERANAGMLKSVFAGVAVGVKEGVVTFAESVHQDLVAADSLAASTQPITQSKL